MRSSTTLTRTMALVLLSMLLAACSAIGGGGPTATPRPSASPTPTPEPSVESVGGIAIVECTYDADDDPDCVGPGLRVKQPVAVDEQVRVSVRIKNVTDEPVGPVAIHVIESSASLAIKEILPFAGCSRPCDHLDVDEGQELLAEFQALIQPQKAVTFTLVLTAREVGEHSIDVAIFAKAMADVETTGADPDQIASWIGVPVTVTE